MKILVTGCAGFIGFHLVKALIKKKNIVVGIDSLNNYYSKSLKINRLRMLKKNKKNFFFFKKNLININEIEKIFKKNKF